MSSGPGSPSFVPAEYEWLLLRFEADRRSRAPGLLARAQAHAGRHAPVRILDLGAGSGSNLLYLAPRLPAPVQEWTLIDRDAALVSRVEASFAAMAPGIAGMELGAGELRAGDRTIRYRLEIGDFLRGDGGVFQKPWDLVVANAVFDLLSAEQLARFFDLAVEHWQRSRPPMYFTINLDHELAIEPGAAHDRAVRALFHAHMQRQQWFGRALGADSAEAMARIAGQRGLLAHGAPSPWRIGADQPQMLHANLDFVDHAAHEMLAGPPAAEGGAGAQHLSARELGRWLDERRAQIDRGELTLSVGHQDLWITWPEPASGSAAS
jgi:SAM-dependent methyltransferase